MSQMKDYFLVDPQTQMPIESYRLPSDWSASGKVVWNISDKSNFVLWAAIFKDTRTGCRVKTCSAVHLSTFGPASSSPCAQNPQALVQMFQSDLCELTGQTSGFQPVSVSLKPTSDAGFRDKIQAAAGMMPGVTNCFGLEFSAVYSYLENGTKQRAMTTTPLVGYDCRSVFQMIGLLELVRPIISAGPDSEMDAFIKTLDDVIISCKPNPAWRQMYENLSMKISEEYRISSTQATRRMCQSMEQARQSQMQSFRQRMNSSPSVGSTSSDVNQRVSDMWSDCIRETEEHADPFDSGQSLIISNQHEHAWVNSSNEVVYSDNSLWNPNTDSTFNKTEWRDVKE